MRRPDKTNQRGPRIQQGNFIVIRSIDLKDDIRLPYLVAGHDFSSCLGKGLIVKAGQLPGAAFYRDAKAEFEQLLNGLRRGGGPGLLG